MPMLEKYRDYFDIDPEYFPAINESVIRNRPDLWKKFYPHETFVRLIKNTVNVLERKQKLSLWVEGSYGTGKSHAVLTLKKLLDADEKDTLEYFQKYNLDADLLKRFQAVKSDGKILTVHRYGSATIHSDHNLVFAIQESVEKALMDAGIENKGSNSLKDATIAWLTDKYNRTYFNDLITGAYSDLFDGDTVNGVVEKLSSYTDDALSNLMDKIFKVADERQIRALDLSVSALIKWIREIINTNGLKAIVFIWDEFTEYFYHNARKLTGFQELCELSETDPFYFILVTHLTQGLFHEDDQDFIKLNGRFVSPHCIISLPENIAFQLMGAAMEKNEDKEVAEDWAKVRCDLEDRTKESRKLIRSAVNITDNDMMEILPIHPYAALILKNISSVFDSNQRSMFDFIKNDRGDEIKGFQWFINNYGPLDENPLLTVDMLWEFFYEKGKEYLAHDVRSILDYYYLTGNEKLNSEQKRVLKTVLLLQAISQRIVSNEGKIAELFASNDKNISKVFEGTDMENHVSSCLGELVRDKVLYDRTFGSGKPLYAAYSNEMDLDLSEHERLIDQKTTTALITEELIDKSTVADAVSLGGALKLRYELRCVSLSDFESKIRQIRNTEGKYENKIVAVACFAKDDQESIAIGKKITDALKYGINNIVFIDASRTTFGIDGYKTYRHDMALSMAQQGKDNKLAKQYSDNAKDSLRKWKNRIMDGEFIVYTKDMPDGDHASTIDALDNMLAEINRKKFPKCLEGNYTVKTDMYTASNLKLGVECACKQKNSGIFSSGSPVTKLENALEGAWNVDQYWVLNPYLYISKLKIFVGGIIRDSFNNNGGRVSIREIYDKLKGVPYGFMPCNLSAFILGFVLKEYINGVYSWSDGLTNDILDLGKLKEMIDEVIRLDITPNPRYRDKYIVEISDDEKAFDQISSTVFNIPIQMCSSISDTRERIRNKMQGFSFPIWTLKYILESEPVKTEKSILSEIIDLFCGIANSNNIGMAKSENEIAMSIGRLSLSHPDAAEDLKRIMNKEKCTDGMIAYLHVFDEGKLVALADAIGDGGQYINAVRKKFNSDAANWVWNMETAQQKICEVILEYRIILESNKVIPKSVTYDSMLQEWSSKCNYIRISFDAGKNSFGDLGQFLKLLYGLKKTGMIRDSQKEEFLEVLSANVDEFRKFYDNQVEVFKRVCGYYLVGLNEEDIQEIYKMMPAGSFTYEKAEYLNKVESNVNSYRNNMKSTQLKKWWREKTHSESPHAWSKEHKMPILCLIPYSELYKARSAFSAVNQKNPNTAEVDKAMEYFESTSFFSLLDNEVALDRAFREKIIKNYAVMLTDIQEVKEYLSNVMLNTPYEWFGDPTVDERLKEMAEAKYNQGGYDRALEKIDSMDISSVKRYLKDLVRDNMIVGMEIIKEDQG